MNCAEMTRFVRVTMTRFTERESEGGVPAWTYFSANPRSPAPYHLDTDTADVIYCPAGIWSHPFTRTEDKARDFWRWVHANRVTPCLTVNGGLRLCPGETMLISSTWLWRLDGSQLRNCLNHLKLAVATGVARRFAVIGPDFNATIRLVPLCSVKADRESLKEFGPFADWAADSLDVEEETNEQNSEETDKQTAV